MPFHGAILSALGGAAGTGGALLQGAIKKVALAKVIWPAMRTVGWIGEQVESGLVGIFPGAEEPIRRFAAAQRFLGSFPSFIPLMASFRRGAAYRNVADVAEGWLSFFPELLIGGTSSQSLTIGMAGAINKGDWVEVLDIVADAFVEAGLEDPVALLRGITQIGKDLETIFGIDGSMTTLTTTLGEALNKINDGELVNLQDLLNFLDEFTMEEKPREPRKPKKPEEARPPEREPEVPARPRPLGEPREVLPTDRLVGEVREIAPLRGRLLKFATRIAKQLGIIFGVVERIRKTPEGRAFQRRVIREFRIPKEAVEATETILQKISRILARGN